MPPPAPPASKAGGMPGAPAPAASGPAPAPSFNLAGLSGLLGGDLSRLPQLAGLANFPSLPPVSRAHALPRRSVQSCLVPCGQVFAGQRQAGSFSNECPADYQEARMVTLQATEPAPPCRLPCRA
jgi:hypothetical protein